MANGRASGWVSAAIVAGFLVAACSSDSGGSGASTGTCGAVCGCVVEHGGDLNTCNDECDKTKAAGGDQKASCELKLDATGYSVCKPKCEGFPTS